MKEPRHDDERLAALLEGRLEGPERDELLAYLATADEDLYVFAKTAAALREMEEEEAEGARQAAQKDTQTPVHATPPPSVRGGWRRWKASRVIVPPVLAGLLALGILTTRAGGAAYAGDPVRLAERLELRQPVTLEPPADIYRGTAEQGAARAGALLTNLAVAIQTRDTAIQSIARSIRLGFDKQAVPSSPIRQIEDRPTEPPSVLLPLVSQATDRLMDRMDRTQRGYLQLGAWTAAAQLAANERNTEFFRSGATRTMLRRAEKLTRGNDAAQGAVAQVRAARDAVLALPAADADDAGSWDTLRTSLEALRTAIGS